MKHILYCLCFWVISTVSFAQTLVDIDAETWTARELTSYVGQTITFTSPFYVCNNYNSLVISPRRTMSPTNQAIPESDAYYDIIRLNNTGEVTLTNVNNNHRLGERIDSLTVYVSSTSSVKAVGTPTFVGNTREDLAKGYSSVDMLGKHTLLICAFNLEYYLVENLGTGFGPDNQADANKQHAKIMDALTHIEADVFGFVEVEQGQAALKKLAVSLSNETGREYKWINDGGSSYGSYTKSGYVYCAETVRPYGELQNNDAQVRNRKKIQAFTEIATGETFIFSLNHFKAKSGTGYGADADQGDGQGTFNATRVKEAESVLNALNNSKSYYNDGDVLLMGDLNAYGKEDPIMTLINGGLTDLYRYFHADSAYSYVFRGQAGYLDHALANSTMLRQITGMQPYHINSDENDRYTYDKSNDQTMFRSSDHDPVIVGLALGKTAALPSIDSSFDDCYVHAAHECLTIFQAKGGYCRIYDVMGTLVYNAPISNETENIRLNTPAGMYIVQVYVENKGKTFKTYIQ